MIGPNIIFDELHSFFKIIQDEFKFEKTMLLNLNRYLLPFNECIIKDKIKMS